MASKGSNLEFARLQAKDPRTWAVSEVGMWLDFIECREFKISFIENSIAGAELFELEDDDLVTIGVKKLAVRKKILTEIKNLQKIWMGGSGSRSATNSRADSLKDDRSSTSGDSSPHSEFSLKCYFEDEIRAIRIKQDCTLSEVKKKIKQEFGQRLRLKWKDEDGDEIPIRKDRHWKSVMAAGLRSGSVKIILSEKSDTLINSSETDVLETLVDGVIIIDSKGTIFYLNRAAERTWGYSRTELLGQNVKMLMPQEYSDSHDQYLANYLRTGVAKIIGSGRKVQGKRRDGSTFPAYLSISETKISGRHTFTGTVRDLTGKEPLAGGAAASLAAAAQFTLLENLLDTAIVIDSNGIIQFFNRQATALFGYTPADVIGRNVKVLMPSPDAESHDQYLRNYLTTGKAKVIGSGRDVVAQCKDGSIIPVHLSLTEINLGDGRRFFTGILRRLEKEQQLEKSVLQQEREVLDNLVVPAVIIDEKGIIHGFNKAAQDMLGFSLMDVVGKNVKMLMTGTDSNNHDKYLADYLRTGKSNVIGVGRDVVAQHKNGTAIRTRLSVTTRMDGQRRLFTGVLQKL